MLHAHTDLGTAHNDILQARYNLRIAQVTPVPDVVNHIYAQKDNTTHPSFGQIGVQTGIALPVFDRNQGNRLTAQAELARAVLNVQRVENELTARLAAAYERYENNRVLVRYYREQILPSQVRVYRAIYERYQLEPEKVGYSDIVVAQQTLATALVSYLTALRAQWDAVVDVATLLQTDDLYALGREECGNVPPPLEGLPLKQTWPPAAPEEGAATPLPEELPAPKPVGTP
jgi:cobalt-zinc-cadmium efflux system outer membrane protein